MRTKALLIVIVCMFQLARASNEYHIDIDSDLIAQLGGAPKLEASGDDAEIYVCRFLLGKRKELITLRVYTKAPRDPLTKGTVIKNDGRPLYALGFRPPIVAASIERRFLRNGHAVTERRELKASDATAIDSALVRSNFFDLSAVSPWLFKGDESDELLTGELLIDGRAVIVRRYIGESLPASVCLDAIEKVLKQL